MNRKLQRPGASGCTVIEPVVGHRMFHLAAHLSVSVAACIALFALCQSPARAALPGHQWVVNSSSWNSSDKLITKTCPAGTSPSGAGYDYGGTMNRGGIYAAAMKFTGTRSILTQAVEGQNGFASNWNARAIGICTNTLAGYTVVSNSVSSWSNSTATAVATCPGAKQVIGTGAEIVPDINGNGPGEVMLTSIEPSANTVSVTAQEDLTGTTALWSLKAYAFCADALPGLEIVSNFSASDNTNPKVVSAVCPPGKGVLGAGGAITTSTAFGDISLSQVRPIIYPAANANYSSVKAEGTLGSFVAGDWFLASYAICADL